MITKYENNTSKIITAVAAGAAVGAILGVLFAPDKGSETRRKIKAKGDQIADEVKGTIEKGKQKINDLKVDIEKSVKDTVEGFV